MVGQSLRRKLSIAIKTNMYIRFDISKIVGGDQLVPREEIGST